MIGTDVDATGNIYTVGNFDGTVDFDPGSATVNLVAGSQHAYISKLNTAGSLLWARKFGGTGELYVSSSALDASGNVYVAGTYKGIVDFDPTATTRNLTSSANGSGYVAVLSSSGALLWVKDFQAARTEISSITTDASGRVAIGGYFNDSLVFSPTSGNTTTLTSNGVADVFLAAFSSSGSFQWAKAFGSTTGNDSLGALRFTPSGSIVAAGRFFGEVDFDPGAGSMVRTSTYSYGTYVSDIFMSTFDSNGNFTQARFITGPDNKGVTGMSLDSSGAMYIAGGYAWSMNFNPDGAASYTPVGHGGAFVAKYATDGGFVWGKGFTNANGGSFWALGAGVKVGANGDVWTNGTFTSTVDFDPGQGTVNLVQPDSVLGAYVVKLDSSGSLIWANKVGGSGDIGRDKISHAGDYPVSLALDAAGNSYTAGAFSGVIDFDPSTSTSNRTAAGKLDAFVLRLDDTGVPSVPTTTTTAPTTTTTVPRTTTTTIPRTTTTTSTTLAPNLGAPTNFKATIKDQHILLTSSTVRNAMQYTLERDGVQIGTNSKPEFWDIDRSTISGTYTYTIRAMNSAGAAGTAATKSITIIPPAAPPTRVASSVRLRSLTVQATMATDVKTWQLLRNGIVVGAWPSSKTTVTLSQPVGTATYSLAGLSPTGYVKPVGSFSATIAP